MPAPAVSKATNSTWPAVAAVNVLGMGQSRSRFVLLTAAPEAH
jgi:hypothetical protein